MSETEWEDRLENEFPELDETVPKTNEEAGPGAEEIPAEAYEEEDTLVEDADGTAVKPEPERKPEDEEEPLEKFTEKISGYDAEISASLTEQGDLTKQKAELESKLAKLKSSRDGDDWFGEEDHDDLEKAEKELAEVTDKLTAAGEKGEKARREKAAAFWDREERLARKEHADFDEVVYEKFAPLLDAETGDPGVIAAWNGAKDKSPKGCYAFAKKVMAFQDWVNGGGMSSPAGTQEPKSEVRGKAGLDLLNSATGPAETGNQSGDVIDRLFPTEN